MIGKIVKGRGFRGVLDYALLKEKGKLIGSNMASDSPRGLAAEFGAIRQLKPRVKNAVFHAALSAPKSDQISEEVWLRIASEYLKKMGFGKSQYVIVRHSDADHDHIHIIANRITFDALIVSDSKDFERQEKSLRAIEKQFGLLPLAAPKKSAVKPSTQGESAQADRTGELSHRMLIQGFCAAAADLASSLEEYVSQLKQWGVKTTLFTKDNKATLKGIVYELDDFKIASGKLGRDFMPAGLAERGLVYSLKAIEPVKTIKSSMSSAEQLEVIEVALDNYTRLYALDKAVQAVAWQEWLMRDPQGAVAWCIVWCDGEDAGHIPAQEQVTEASQAPHEQLKNDGYSPGFER